MYWSAYYILHTQHCTQHTGLSTMYAVYPIVYTVHCTLYTLFHHVQKNSTLKYILNILDCKHTLHSAHCILQSANCKLIAAHCTLHTAHCTLHSAHKITFTVCSTLFTSQFTVQNICIFQTPKTEQWHENIYSAVEDQTSLTLEELDWVALLIADKCVCRTASATAGLSPS